MPTVRLAKPVSFEAPGLTNPKSFIDGGSRIPTARAVMPPHTGNLRPGRGLRFPKRFAPVLELQCAPISRAVVRIEREHRTPKHASHESECPHSCHELKVHACSGPQRLVGLHERAARAEIHDAHGAARTQRRPRDARTR